ncbi:MAG: hypothetical protein JOY92_00140, partial [Verrucomicrobia bacterium]|nr:hypothetical protein [Verrucomicrobiota bacterium]
MRDTSGTNSFMQLAFLPYARTRFDQAARYLVQSLALITGITFIDGVQAQVVAPPPSGRVLRAAPVQEAPDLYAHPPVTRPALPPSSANDAARYLAGMPVSAGSPLAGLTSDPRWIAHANAMDAAFARLDQRQLSAIREWQAQFLAPVTRSSRTCLYFFSGPDFLLADAFYPDCTTYILVSLEPVESIPQLQSMPPDLLQSSLQNIEMSLNTFLQFGFFETKELRTYSQRSSLKGVLPIILVFLARSGNEISNVDYTPSAGNRGVRISFVDSATGAHKVLYYISADLSDEGLRRNSGLLRFCGRFGSTNSFLKAASYLLHGNSFNLARNYLLQVSASILQDDSGIPLRNFTPDKWTLRFFGSYNGPIELFKNFYQPDLYQYYATS